jgi:hypothetical protein
MATLNLKTFLYIGRLLLAPQALLIVALYGI